MKQVILILFVLSALTAVSEAAPLQTLGGLRTPDAYLIPHRSVKVTLVGYYRNVERPSYVDQDKNGLHFYGMVGVGMFDWAEVACGVPEADACRSYLGCYISQVGAEEIYLKKYCAATGRKRDDILAWLPVVAGSTYGFLSPKAKEIIRPLF